MPPPQQPCLESRCLDSRLILQVLFGVFDRVLGPVRTHHGLNVVEVFAPDLGEWADIRLPLDEARYWASARDHGQGLSWYQRVAPDKPVAFGDFAGLNRVHHSVPPPTSYKCGVFPPPEVLPLRHGLTPRVY
jgi:hypothetical protein